MLHSVVAGHTRLLGSFTDVVDAWRAVDAVDLADEHTSAEIATAA